MADKEKQHIHRWEESPIRRLLSRVLANVTPPADLICCILHAGRKQVNSQAQRCCIGRYVNGVASRARRLTANMEGCLTKRRQFRENVSVILRECLICRTHRAGKNKTNEDCVCFCSHTLLKESCLQAIGRRLQVLCLQDQPMRLKRRLFGRIPIPLLG